MEYYNQPSQPNRLTICCDEPEFHDLFSENDMDTADAPPTVFDYLRDNNGIGWDWSQKRDLEIGDRVLIYFSGKGANRIARLTCLTEITGISFDKGLEKPLAAYLKKIYWFNENESEQLSFEKLKDNGLKTTLAGLLGITDNIRLKGYIDSIINLDRD
ncbi:MAG TPA: hypothetical protein PLE30_11520 [Candidatus Kapabacteria bacterium]|nr:hypothetical protein [Candidatus Kapabacteria bacterium]